jgi:dienelactone hydrolase
MRRLFCLAVTALPVLAQITSVDYDRAAALREKLPGLALNITGPVTWIEGTNHFYYRKSIRGGGQFVLVDAETLTKKPAFDHEKLAASLTAAAGQKYTALTLPLADLTFLTGAVAIQFNIAGAPWRCGLVRYDCARTTPVSAAPARRPPDESPNDVYDGMVMNPPQQGRSSASAPDSASQVRLSPDGKWEALIRNYNVFVKAKGATQSWPLSVDGSEGNYYTRTSLTWSPDSKYIAAYRVRPGYRRQIHFIESSPDDQLQPKASARDYAKPGDALDIAQPVLFTLDDKKQTIIDNNLFPNPYSLSNPVWRKDSRAFTFEYNQRGHQIYRVIEVTASGEPRALITEESKTFVAYRPLVPNPRDTGKKFRHEIDDGKEIIWASERDGWGHLYLYDGITGKVKNQITKGNWVVRAVDWVDEQKRQVWFQASGMTAGKDPYLTHHYRINFDGSGLTGLTSADANHTIVYSSDRKHYVDTFSRVDLPPTVELRRTSDQKLLLEVERGDITALTAAGWRPPEVFTAMARDGKTDIWGVIYRPPNFEASKKYPVVEFVYAGPQGSFVPKTFGVIAQPLTELGFIVAQIDGMGTNNRSKAFHDVAWKNLADAGFPDRILWHQAVAARYPYYDISRVGIYGTSAGGQNAMGALLFHPEFYKAAVANSGCHDNRMDKIWWNELWMGWPIGPQYAASSNVDNAHRLKGKLLLVVGEMDTNVDPASTLQVVNALIRAKKKHDLLFVPGGGHGAGGTYAQRLLQDFFVHHLHGVEPPDWAE